MARLSAWGTVYAYSPHGSPRFPTGFTDKMGLTMWRYESRF
ncbi:hypothetical protein KQCUZIGB_CDS0064 [Pectobacterium phage Ymer]|uniref:Uncharacterized protein n=2 Tax=unclassified Caudoviricetes TaxID=2788787 RepID=A0AB39ABT7_9CAUD